MSEIFEKFDIFGVPESSEDAILACIMQGEPALLIGPPGTAKTEILECIGSAFRELSKTKNPKDEDKWFKFKLYDASKLNPEDLMGFPNPKSLMNGEMDFIKLKSSIWDKDMVVFDEINRCEKNRQSNLFEIIRSRRMMGIDLPTKLIFSSMNPFGDTGTMEMSDALSDRHMFFLWFQSFSDMKSPDQQKIMNRMGAHEGVGLRHWDPKRDFTLDTTEKGKANPKLADSGAAIEDIVKAAIPIYDNLNTDIGNKVNKLIIRLADILSQEKQKDPKVGYLEVNGRRANLIKRGILSMRAIQLAKAAILGTSPPDLQACLINSIQMLLPIGVGTKISADSIVRIKKVIADNVQLNYDAIFSDDVNADSVYMILNQKNPILRLHGLLTVSNLSAIISTKVWSELYDSIKDKEPELEYSLFLLKQAVPGLIPPHIVLNEQVTRSEDMKEIKVQASANFKVHKATLQSMLASVSSNKLIFNAASAALIYLTNRHHNADEVETSNLVGKLCQIVNQVRTLYENKVNPTNATPSATP